MFSNVHSLQNQGTGALVVSSMLDFLTFALCVPYSETTDGKHFDQLLEMVAERGRTLFRLFQVSIMILNSAACSSIPIFKIYIHSVKTFCFCNDAFVFFCSIHR